MKREATDSDVLFIDIEAENPLIQCRPTYVNAHGDQPKNPRILLGSF